MSKEERIPRKRSHGPMSVGEKPKNLKKAVKRLAINLKPFKILIFISLILACLGSILSLVAPNKLSDLTDKISQGLMPNTTNFEKLNTNIKSNMSEDNLKEKANIIMTSDISLEEKLAFSNTISHMKDKNNISEFTNLSPTVLNILFPTFKVDNISVTSSDQIAYISIMSGIKDMKNSKELYSAYGKLPNNLKKILEPQMNISKIKDITIILLILYFVSALFEYIESLAMTDVSNNFAKNLRTRISKKINKLPLKYFDKNETGNILSIVTNDVDTIAQSMNQSLASFVSSVTLFLGAIIMMFYTNWILAITAILSSLIGFVFMALILSKSQKYFIARQEELGKLNGHIEEIYSGLNIVKAYNGKKDADKKFDKLNKSVYECNRKSQFLSGLMMPIMGFVGNLGYVAVCVVGALLTMNDTISFGVIVAFIMYVRMFTSPLSQIAQALTSLQSTSAASERVFDFLDEEELLDESRKDKYLSRSDIKGNVAFSHVKFGYDENRIIIKDFNAIIKPGQKIAIVGPTGAGKTTMVNLLMKFYELNSGDIKIEDVSTKELTRENIHELFTMVLQDTWLFEGTVKDNIIYNRQDVSDTKVKEVCKCVGIDHFIKTLSDGYDTVIEDDDSISSGQRQLLTIARGMIEDAPFLILDEATSNVDTRTEELVQKAMDKLMEGRTSFIIAHRLSTIKNADLILVMKDGNIIEQGTQEELMQKKGFYADLYNSQFLKSNS